MDEDGTICIKGRTAEAVRFKVFSEVVYPAPIEHALVEMPAIADAQVRLLLTKRRQFQEDPLKMRLNLEPLKDSIAFCV